jgi:hypothetical protein
MRKSDWTAREVCNRAGAVVVTVDYRAATGRVHYPVPLDDTVAGVRWMRGRAGHPSGTHPPAGAARRAADVPDRRRDRAVQVRKAVEGRR